MTGFNQIHGAEHTNTWEREQGSSTQNSCPPGIPDGLISNFEIKSFYGRTNVFLGLASVIAAVLIAYGNTLQSSSHRASFFLLFKYPTYFGKNIWPDSALPELEVAFKAIGRIMLDVGLLVAYHCDRYVSRGMNMGADECLKNYHSSVSSS